MRLLQEEHRHAEWACQFSPFSMTRFLRKNIALLHVSAGLLLALLGATLLAGCATVTPGVSRPEAVSTLYLPPVEESTILGRYAPAFVVEGSDQPWNRIGSPVASLSGNGAPVLHLDTGHPVLFTEEHAFRTEKGRYLNLVYRIHFSGVPFSLIPFHLTAGTGSGLLAIITLDAGGKPLLLSLVHTCGCYLTFIPTSFLDPDAYPPGWDTQGQTVYGVAIPGLLDYEDSPEPHRLRLALSVLDDVHRIVGVRLVAEPDRAIPHGMMAPLPLKPMEDLEHLPLPEGETSFFETEGPRRGYVRNSSKPLEAFLMSWWAFDPFIGEDKALGRFEKTGVVFNTSLKFWDREASNMGDFATFLRYWQWGL